MPMNDVLIIGDYEKGLSLTAIITQVNMDEDSDSDSHTTEDAYQIRKVETTTSWPVL